MGRCPPDISLSRRPRREEALGPLIVSADALAANCRVLWAAMITTAKGGTLAEDIPVTDPREAGLPEDCVIRPSRLFTIADELVDRRLGTLKPRDRNAVAAFLKKHLP